MNPEILLASLDSDNPDVRLKAARGLLESATKQHLVQLRVLLAKERVLWVRKAVQRVVDRLERLTPEPPQRAPEVSQAEWEQEAQDAESRGRRLALHDVLHEMEPEIGTLELHLLASLEDYESSEAKKRMERIQRLLAVFRSWAQTSGPLQISSVSIEKLVRRLIVAESWESQVSFEGPESTQCKTDEGQLELCLRNAIRNAVESVSSFGVEKAHGPVVVNWGATDKEVWVAVLDRGGGLRIEQRRAFEPGISTKGTGRGHGLAVVQRAASRLNAAIELKNRDGGGAKFLLTLPLKGPTP